MDDAEIVRRIGELVDREHHLETTHGSTPLDAAGVEELHSLEVQLDQCWDLLRQRRAKREFGAKPDEAAVRDAQTVEHYQQ